MEQIRVFENPSFGKIRTAGTSEQPLFCLADVCRALGLTPKGVNQRLNDEVISNYPILDSLGRTQNALFVNEDGLYDVILDSRKPEAKVFRKWVTSEVLPSIRKHGAYMSSDTIERAITDPDFLIKLATELKNEKQARAIAEQKVEKQTKQLELQAPKVELYEMAMKSDDLVDMQEIAKTLNFAKMGRNNIFKILREKGILDSKNQPYQKYVDCGYFKIVESVKIIGGKSRIFLQTFAFQKGVEFVKNTIKDGLKEQKSNNQMFFDL